MMHFKQIESIIIEILQEADGRFLLPYQIFEKIRVKDQALAQHIENEYPSAAGRPPMGAGAGIYYSPASFIAHALDSFMKVRTEITKEWLVTSDISIKEVQPGSEEGVSIWAWKETT
ncbi:hypothetical protein AMJ80_04865 [bacterium SM23_31]|nr:MAG: hypothetical protein AMJ80_04865 [bacterium SM23_31]